MANIEQKLKNYDSKVKVVYKSICNIASLTNEVEINWESVLSQFTTTSELTEIICNNTDPLFSLVIPTPRVPSSGRFTSKHLDCYFISSI